MPLHLDGEPQGHAAGAIVEAENGRPVQVFVRRCLDPGAGATVHHVSFAVDTLGNPSPRQIQRRLIGRP